jgi:hypothetical protein
MKPVSATDIVRCLKRDLDYNLPAAVRYARKIATAARCNPWADSGDAEAYEEAAKRLEKEIKESDERESDWAATRQALGLVEDD